jgi:hypothetical protein
MGYRLAIDWLSTPAQAFVASGSSSFDTFLPGA